MIGIRADFQNCISTCWFYVLICGPPDRDQASAHAIKGDCMINYITKLLLRQWILARTENGIGSWSPGSQWAYSQRHERNRVLQRSILVNCYTIPDE